MAHNQVLWNQVLALSHLVAKFKPPGLIQPSYQQEDLRAKQKTEKGERGMQRVTG